MVSSQVWLISICITMEEINSSSLLRQVENAGLCFAFVPIPIGMISTEFWFICLKVHRRMARWSNTECPNKYVARVWYWCCFPRICWMLCWGEISIKCRCVIVVHRDRVLVTLHDFVVDQCMSFSAQADRYLGWTHVRIRFYELEQHSQPLIKCWREPSRVSPDSNEYFHVGATLLNLKNTSSFISVIGNGSQCFWWWMTSTEKYHLVIACA
jgi:hypothetical protein